MLQRVPPEGGYAVIADDVEDGWRRAMVLMSSATAGELVDPELPPRRLLFRLFHEDGVRVFETHPLEARCRCSRERIARILRPSRSDDIDEMRQDRRHHRDLRILQHQLRIHPGRSGASSILQRLSALGRGCRRRSRAPGECAGASRPSPTDRSAIGPPLPRCGEGYRSRTCSKSFA